MNTRTATNILLTLIAGLLIALVATPASQSAPKSYDAVRLIEYQACLTVNGQPGPSGFPAYNIGVPEATTNVISLVSACSKYRPK